MCGLTSEHIGQVEKGVKIMRERQEINLNKLLDINC